VTAGDGAASLVDTLRARAADDGGNGYWFSAEGAAAPSGLTFAELEPRARDVAAELSMIAPQGSRAVLVYPPGIDFIVGFFGAMCAGVAAVPVYPPGADLRQGLDRLEHVIADARPDVLLTTSALAAAANAAGAEVGPPGMRWLATDEVSHGLGDGWAPPRIPADSPALVQYTSGSTGDPKGVVVLHRQLLANLAALRSAMGLTTRSVAVGWVPSYHDMGLVGFVLAALHSGFSSYLISPQDFLRRPALWLEAISRFGGVVSGGPNFGFELCTRRVTDAELANLDLTSWRLAFSGAERVRPDALRRFAARFASAGFDADAWYPCYGLAEASLFVSGPRPRVGLASTWADRRALEQGQVSRAAPGADDAVEIASCGQPATGHQVVVVDAESARPAADGAVGEIWVAGPSVASGYWRRPQESGAVFGAALADGAGPFLRTGDLGFLRGGELYLTGRSKDMLVVHGRNIYPADVEDVAQAVSPSMRPGCGASFLLDGDSTTLVVVQETGEEDADELRKLALAVRRAVLERLEAVVDDVVLVRPRTLAKTSSGKLRRRACRDDYLAGRLASVFRLRASEPAELAEAQA
jgi:acyl-CoA synthetase (AMP-forming)/AMP-acid ligase II